MKEILEKIISRGGCPLIKECCGCPLIGPCEGIVEQAGTANPVITWVAKGMLYEMERNSLKVFNWLYHRYVSSDAEEIRVFFEHPDYIEGFPITLVNASDNILYFDINGADVRVESHECSEDFGVEQLRLTDILGIKYTVELDNPIRAGK